MPLESSFSYSNAPQAIIPKKKHRDEGDVGFTLMSDPRVVRGSVARNKSGHMTGTGRRNIPGKNRTGGLIEVDETTRNPRPTYQYNVAPMVQPEIDLSQYLIEREDEERKQSSKEVETQTDKFKDRPDTPEFVPRKTGVDVETQVEDVSELFCFDLEVEPMLAVICAKTLEQAMFELECEGELVNLQEECDRFEEIRIAEQQWVTGKEQETIAESCTKDLALKGLHAEMARQRQVREKVAGLQTMRQMLPALFENIVDELYESGLWKDPEREDIDKVYLPEIYASVQQNLSCFKQTQAVIDEIILLAFEGKEAICMCRDHLVGGVHHSKVVLKLMVTGATAGVGGADTVTLGFISIDDNDSVNSINKKVNTRIAEEGLNVPEEVSLHGFLAQALGLSSPESLSYTDVIDNNKLPRVVNVVLPEY